MVFIPDGTLMRAASSGFSEPLADLFWMRVVILFGERFDTSAGDPVWLQWLLKMIVAVTELDPQWRTPYFWGGTMLRVAGDLDGSDLIFERGHAALPDESYFSFSLGMNAYLYRDDAVTAARYLAAAAQAPDAPKWYASAAAAMKQKAGDRRTAIRFLRETLETTTDPGIIKHTEQQLRRLYHNEYVDQWDDACRAYRDQTGAPLSRPEDIEKLGFTLPPNPREDAWIVGGDGVVRSEGAERERLRDQIKREWNLIRK